MEITVRLLIKPETELRTQIAIQRTRPFVGILRFAIVPVSAARTTQYTYTTPAIRTSPNARAPMISCKKLIRRVTQARGRVLVRGGAVSNSLTVLRAHESVKEMRTSA